MQVCVITLELKLLFCVVQLLVTKSHSLHRVNSLVSLVYSEQQNLCPTIIGYLSFCHSRIRISNKKPQFLPLCNKQAGTCKGIPGDAKCVPEIFGDWEGAKIRNVGDKV